MDNSKKKVDWVQVGKVVVAVIGVLATGGLTKK